MHTNHQTDDDNDLMTELKVPFGILSICSVAILVVASVTLMNVLT